jgi:hypothetical protein
MAYHNNDVIIPCDELDMAFKGAVPNNSSLEKLKYLFFAVNPINRRVHEQLIRPEAFKYVDVSSQEG